MRHTDMAASCMPQLLDMTEHLLEFLGSIPSTVQAFLWHETITPDMNTIPVWEEGRTVCLNTLFSSAQTTTCSVDRQDSEQHYNERMGTLPCFPWADCLPPTAASPATDFTTAEVNQMNLTPHYPACPAQFLTAS